MLQSGELIALSRLSVGDRVLSGDGDFSEVIAFTHSSPYARATFVRVNTTTGLTLSVTPNHFMPVNGDISLARDVRVGDYVRSMVMESGTWILKDDKVTGIENRMELGLYNPQTARGDIVVDGVLASCYTGAVDPLPAHALLAPLRALARTEAKYLYLELAHIIDASSSWLRNR